MSRIPPKDSFRHSVLRDAVLSNSTQRSYNNSLHNFLQFAQLSERDFIQLSAVTMDELLVSYINQLHRQGGSYHAAVHALHGIVFQRQDLKSMLNESHLCLRGWVRFVSVDLILL